ncbi:MAG: bifunctional hydroxymethylpyrimidine kinase/phosphomethylpyrimidine kinase [Desulfuromonadales bacterium]|nr:bifunctional hydroxymethylpyrimidine kinase/phosphomethylpyrimidine kinase [Desulfuromonadales bacterium]
MIEGLYLITPEGSEQQIIATVTAALHGGATVVQYRDKQRAPEQQVELGRQLAALCRQAGALFLVNDSPRLAVDCDADGVHLGQGDGSVLDARKIVGPNRTVGVTARSVEQAIKAEMAGADYLGVGAVYATGSKQDTELIGLEGLEKIRRAVKVPIVAVGGLNGRNGSAALEAGADALAVITAVAADPRPALAARELSLLFNRKRDHGSTRVMTVAGSDSGGGAGIQADLKTIALLGSYGSSAITVLTAQNTLGVHGLLPASAEFVARQMELILDDIGTDTVKTGMLYSAEIIDAVVSAIDRRNLLAVVDPVMIAKGGAALLKKEAVRSLRETLLPRTWLLTPNIPEAVALTGLTIGSLEEMEQAARALQRCGARHVLLKGGHRDDGDATDLLLVGDQAVFLPGERLATGSTHGTGCSFAAALATLLAQGCDLAEAAQTAKLFISTAIRQAIPIGQGHGPINHIAGAQAVRG